jgi:ribonuclease HI
VDSSQTTRIAGDLEEK